MDELRWGETFGDKAEPSAHYGVKRRSGRYPWGSGENPYQSEEKFMNTVKRLREKGMSENDIAASMKMSSTKYRNKISIATHRLRQQKVDTAHELKARGLTLNQIAKAMGLPSDSSVRSLLNAKISEKHEQTEKVAELLKADVDAKGYIDVGAGVNMHLNPGDIQRKHPGITDKQMETALDILRSQGYVVYSNVKVEQLTTGHDTTYKVLTKPGTTWSDMMEHRNDIRLPGIYMEDGMPEKIEPPVSIDSKRLAIRYADDPVSSGTERDGLIEIRRGVEDLSLGNARYAQVRIAVDGTHYLKGMAVYADDLPDGIDIRFNTNKTSDKSKMEVLKPMENDPNHPFGASIKGDDELILCQRHYTDKDGNRKLSAINVVNEEGAYLKWDKKLASQFLSKQSPELAKQQLDIQLKLAKEEFDEIKSYGNPTVRARLFDEFAGKCDSHASELDAAALPGQTTSVILPFTSVKEGEIYAPNYNNGEKVALVRYPHAGIFEIPICKVNNNNKEAISTIGKNALDAVGINSKTAAQLSGADFDGDTVIVLPLSSANIHAEKAIKELQDFDPKAAYPGYEGMHKMTKRERGQEMGKISNLITDMTVQGATQSELIRAVKHSMVVIDAYKHGLDYKSSEMDMDIAELRSIYQHNDGRADGGAHTLLSKANADYEVPQRKGLKPLYKMTPEEHARYLEGYNIYEESGKTGVKPVKKKVKDENGEVIGEEIVGWKEYNKTDKVSRRSQVEDAYQLTSGGSKSNPGTKIEAVYAEYSNAMADLARQARKASRAEVDIPYNPSAAKVYAAEVASLDAKLDVAKMNAPKERLAQVYANKAYKEYLWNNPDIYGDSDKIKKIKGEKLKEARKMVGAGKISIDISRKEWEAINSGAIHKSKLKAILSNSKPDQIKSLALPRSSSSLSPSKINMAKSLLANGYSQAEAAERLGVSVSTLMNAVYEK